MKDNPEALLRHKLYCLSDILDDSLMEEGDCFEQLAFLHTSPLETALTGLANHIEAELGPRSPGWLL